MPKLKTKKCVTKRVRITKSGKIKRFKSGKGHLLTGKTAKRRRNKRRAGMVAKSDMAAIMRVLPYGAK